VYMYMFYVQAEFIVRICLYVMNKTVANYFIKSKFERINGA